MNQSTQSASAQFDASMFFTPIGNNKPFFKAAFEGFAGCGKTYTSALVAVGLHERVGSTKPVVIFDTEESAKFLKPLFASHNIPVFVKASKSLADLKQTMDIMRDGFSDILIIDSISHVWEDFLEAYKNKPASYGCSAKTRLEFQDWGIIKPTWKKEFSDRFVREPLHIIMTGRAGYEYESEINEETKKREIYKSGVKMKVEGETAYEPDLLVLMERKQEMEGGSIKRSWREATVIKDRSTLIDGKVFEDPGYEDFSPCVEAMLDNPMPRDAMAEDGNAALLFKTEEDKGEFKRNRDKALEEMDGFLSRIAPASVGKDKQLKLELLELAFGTTSQTAIEEKGPEAIREGYRFIKDEAIARGLVHVVELDGKKVIRVGAAAEINLPLAEEAPAPAETGKPAGKKKAA